MVNTSKRKIANRAAYHHGNLPEVMGRAVLEVIGEKGVQGVSISEAARRAGVSAAAPYRHFKDREDLLVSVALAAYQRLWQRLKEAMDRQIDPDDQMVELIVGCFEYFAEEPAAAELLFHTGMTIAHRELDAVSREGFEYMMEISAKISPQANEKMRRDFVLAVVAICIGSGRMKRDRFSPVTKPDDYREIGDRGVRLLIAGFRAEVASLPFPKRSASVKTAAAKKGKGRG